MKELWDQWAATLGGVNTLTELGYRNSELEVVARIEYMNMRYGGIVTVFNTPKYFRWPAQLLYYLLGPWKYFEFVTLSIG